MTTDLTPHQPSAASGALATFPRRFGRYVLLAPIAAGGMAEVFVADQTGPHGFSRRVALKRIHAHLAQEAGFIQSFLDEARLGACLRHPHVVQIQDLEVIEGVPVAAMEYVEGGHFGSLLLRARTLEKPLPLPLVVELILQVARGLEHAHAAHDSDGRPLRLIHRDLKPSNLLLGFDGYARIVDFGIARASSNLAQTAPDVIKGSVPYMAPEQASGESLSAASDLFSLGAVFYEMLTLKRLHQGETQGALLIRAALGPSPEALSRLGSLPDALGAVLGRLLAVAPGDRFASASELIVALEEAGHVPLSPARLAAWAREWLVGVRQPPLPSAEVLAAFRRSGSLSQAEGAGAAVGTWQGTVSEGTSPWGEPLSVLLPSALLRPDAGAAMTVTPLLLVRAAAPGADVPISTGQTAPTSEPWGTSPDCLSEAAITGPPLELVPGRRRTDAHEGEASSTLRDESEPGCSAGIQALPVQSLKRNDGAIPPTPAPEARAAVQDEASPGALSQELPHTLPDLLAARGLSTRAAKPRPRAHSQATEAIPAPEVSSPASSREVGARPSGAAEGRAGQRSWGRPVLALSLALVMLIWGSTRLLSTHRVSSLLPAGQWGWVYVLEPAGAQVSLREVAPERPGGASTGLGIVPLRFRPGDRTAEVLLELTSSSHSVQRIGLTRATAARAIRGGSQGEPEVLALPAAPGRVP